MDHSTDHAAVLAVSGMPAMSRLGRLQLNCDRHGTFMATGTRLRLRDVWESCPLCREDRERVEQARLAESRRLFALQELEEKIRDSAVPVRFIGKTLDNFNAETEAQRYALTVARDYLETFDQRRTKGEGLILSGMPGTGKSHIAGAILQAVLATRYTGLYMTCMGAIRLVRGTWRKDSEQGELEVLDTLGTVSLLVLDEIGVQYGTDGEQTIIFDILDRRYRDMRPTLLLTNQDKAGLKTFIGERAYDRLTETCRWVPFDWPSYRAQARKESA